jgi:hypothetical protein
MFIRTILDHTAYFHSILDLYLEGLNGIAPESDLDFL